MLGDPCTINVELERRSVTRSEARDLVRGRSLGGARAICGPVRLPPIGYPFLGTPSPCKSSAHWAHTDPAKFYLSWWRHTTLLSERQCRESPRGRATRPNRPRLRSSGRVRRSRRPTSLSLPCWEISRSSLSVRRSRRSPLRPRWRIWRSRTRLLPKLCRRGRPAPGTASSRRALASTGTSSGASRGRRRHRRRAWRMRRSCRSAIRISFHISRTAGSAPCCSSATAALLRRRTSGAWMGHARPRR